MQRSVGTPSGRSTKNHAIQTVTRNGISNLARLAVITADVRFTFKRAPFEGLSHNERHAMFCQICRILWWIKCDFHQQLLMLRLLKMQVTQPPNATALSQQVCVPAVSLASLQRHQVRTAAFGLMGLANRRYAFGAHSYVAEDVHAEEFVRSTHLLPNTHSQPHHSQRLYTQPHSAAPNSHSSQV